jgi:outer membrane protein assembly factor BamB
MTYSFEKNTVFQLDQAGNKTPIASLNHPVLKIIEVAEGICVLTEPSPKATRVANLFLLDADGATLWTVAASFAAGDKNVFVDAKPHAEHPGQLIAWDWDGNRYSLAASSGKELAKTFLK